MILGDKREEVIENIRKAAEAGSFHSKVEVGDPVLTDKEKESLLKNHLRDKKTLHFRINSWTARRIIGIATRQINKETMIAGLENIEEIRGGAIVTSNHFSPVDNTVVRTLVWKAGKKRLPIVSQETNLAMTGWVGFLMKYADVIPISGLHGYMSRKFGPTLKRELDKQRYVLIYPEQEMWFNYRKPRPFKRGAYYYAAKFQVPIISCFVEMADLEELDTPEFHKIRYIMHVLPVIYPDSEKSVRDNSIAMCRQDYEQKKSAYEAAYGKPLDYQFHPEDIAGWIRP